MKKDDKPRDDMTMPADDFDRIMRKALGVPAPVEGKKPQPAGPKPRKARTGKK